MTHFEQLKEAAEYIKNRCSFQPDAGIVLGSGLGNFTAEIEPVAEMPYKEIPHFPVSTVEGHSGRLIFGTVSGKNVVAMAGRFHYYEGYTPEQVVFPIRVLKMLGIKTLFISNAAGGVKKGCKVGDLVIIRDQISMLTVNPLIGKNYPELGPRFPDMSKPFNRELIQKATAIAEKAGIDVYEGVYCGVTGPTFETRAEYKMIQNLGGDVVGMSTVQEVIAAVHMGLPVFAMSIVTDVGNRDEDNTITHDEVLQAAKEAEPKLTHIFRELIGSIA